MTGHDVSGNRGQPKVTRHRRCSRLAMQVRSSGMNFRSMARLALKRIIDLASELGSDGREGEPIGAMFVLGDTDRVLSLSRPRNLNPFIGFDERERNVFDPSHQEAVKELNTLDGAFLVKGDGVVESIGDYLRMGSTEDYDQPNILGARHRAAAGITAVTDSIATTVSDFTGTVFRNGKILTEVENRVVSAA